MMPARHCEVSELCQEHFVHLRIPVMQALGYDVAGADQSAL